MTKAKAINFEALDLGTAHERGFRFNFKHPQTGDDLDAWVRVRGEESPVVQAFLEAEFDRERRRKDDDPTPLADLSGHAVEKATVATIEWGNVAWGDEQLECTPENCRKIYSNKAFRAQVLEAITTEANFPLG